MVVTPLLSHKTGFWPPTAAGVLLFQTPKVYGLTVIVPEAANPPAHPGPAEVNE